MPDASRNDKPGRATGPRTPEGKARSSQNARNHGLTAQTVPLDPALRAQYDQLRKDYEDELGHRGPLEMSIFEKLVLAARIYAARACCGKLSQDCPSWQTKCAFVIEPLSMCPKF